MSTFSIHADRWAFETTAGAAELRPFEPFHRRMERQPSQWTAEGALLRRYERRAFQEARRTSMQR